MLRPSQSPHHVETPGVRLRRRVVVAATSVVGAVLLGLAVAQPARSSTFYWLTLALAATWITGGLLSGPLHLGRAGGRPSGRREVLAPAVLGAAAFGVFALGALIVRQVPVLHSAVRDVIDRADDGRLWLVVVVALANGVAEEVFFRGALYSAFGPHHPAPWSTVAYVTVTAAAGNVMLVFAAAVMGTVFALERRATRGILASTVTHVTWSALMIFLLPR